MAHTENWQPGAGATLAYCTTLGGSYVPVALGVEITGPDPSVEDIATTILSSTVKTSRPSLPDSAELGMSGFCDPASVSHQAMIAALYAGTVLFWKLTYGDIQATVDAFQGYLKKFTRNGLNVDSNIGYDLSIKVTTVFTTTHTNPTL